MFDYDRLNFLTWFLLGGCVLIGGNLYFAGKTDNDVASRERTPAGTVQTISNVSSFWGDTSTLQLESGQVVILDGTINPWQPGEAVSHPVIHQDDSERTKARLKNTWCVGNECYSQH